MTFIRCIRSHPVILFTPLYFVRAFLFRSHPVVSFSRFFHISLFQHLSISSGCFIHVPPLRLHLIPLYFPSEPFLSNLRVCFELYSPAFLKKQLRVLCNEMYFIRYFCGKIKSLFVNGIYGGYTDVTIGEEMSCKSRCKPYRRTEMIIGQEIIIGHGHVRFVMRNGRISFVM